jgi:dolichol-phosphate mannosyltransferase
MTRRAFSVAQALAAAVALARLARGRRRRPPLAARATDPVPGLTVSVVIPARDEEGRLAGCLVPLLEDGGADEVIVVDDRSADATAEVARGLGARVVEGAELPPGWVGKPWALHQGLRAATGDVVVTLDADTRPRLGLVRALVHAVAAEPERTLTSATARFDCRTAAERVLHPSLLATLAYRFGPLDAVGPPPRASRAVANGQCLAVRRTALEAEGGFAAARDRMTDDVALARALRARGWGVAVHDAGDLLEVRMYESLAETWREWGRSIAMPDVTAPGWQAADVAVVWLAMALPLPRLLAGRGTALDRVLVAVRLVLHAALARAYRSRGAAFWVAPLADLAAAVRLTVSAVRPLRVWRGRTY